MHADESSKINPYAPSTLEIELADEARDSFPQSGLPFAGVVDLRSVRKTRRVSLSVGLVIALSFIGLLLSAAAAMADAGASAILAIAAGLTALAIWAFVHGQTDRPLLRFHWMHGLTDGTLMPHRLDIRWNDGESEGSFRFSRTSAELDFLNRHGRLFVLRSIPCFIPMQSISPDLWQYVKAFRPNHSSSHESAEYLKQPPAPSNDTALTWEPADESFFFDRRRHESVCAAPIWPRMIFVFAIMFLGLLYGIDQQSEGVSTARVAVTVIAMLSGGFWLAVELGRRGWLSSRTPSISLRKSVEPAPNYRRWIDSRRLLVGYDDAWICVPWSAVQQATISQYAIQFSFTPLGLDDWVLERGRFTDRQWQAIIDHVRSRTTRVDVWGAARRPRSERPTRV